MNRAVQSSAKRVQLVRAFGGGTRVSAGLCARRRPGHLSVACYLMLSLLRAALHARDGN